MIFLLLCDIVLFEILFVMRVDFFGKDRISGFWDVFWFGWVMIGGGGGGSVVLCFDGGIILGLGRWILILLYL